LTSCRVGAVRGRRAARLARSPTSTQARRNCFSPRGCGIIAGMKDFTPMHDALIGWFEAHAEDLPWRHTRDPYRIWLSEIMLQQTQIAAVLPYYARFVERFPTVEALAAAPLDDVLKLWEGLGYY